MSGRVKPCHHIYSPSLSMILLNIFGRRSLVAICHHCVLEFCLYADISLLAPSVYALQIMVTLSETELNLLDMYFHAKSLCMRFGSCFNVKCANITINCGQHFKLIGACRYLGLYVFVVYFVMYICFLLLRWNFFFTLSR